MKRTMCVITALLVLPLSLTGCVKGKAELINNDASIKAKMAEEKNPEALTFVSRSAASIIKLMSYNLKHAGHRFKPAWKIRREMQVKLFRQYSPDIIGTQEGL